MLTKQYGAQLSMKTAMAITVMRTSLVMYSFWRTWKWRHSAMKSSRLRRSLKVKNSYMLLRLRSTDRQGYFAESRMTLSLVKLDCVADVIYPRLVTSAQERWNPRTGNAFRISFQPDWQIDNGFCNNPIMARTQILVLIWGLITWIMDFSAVSQTDLARV